jgi:hypothetical protein
MKKKSHQKLAKNLRTKTIGDFRAIYDPDGDAIHPWLVQRRSGRGGWGPEMTYKDGPARFAKRDHAINCAWNLAHFDEICAGRLKERNES